VLAHLLLAFASLLLFVLTTAICTHAPGLIPGYAQWLVLISCSLAWTRVFVHFLTLD